MYIYSGNCRLCKTGLTTKLKSVFGNTLSTGDIVVIYTFDVNLDLLSEIANGLTVVVRNDFQSYSDGTVKVLEDGFPFVMGIAGCVPIEIDGRHYLKSEKYNTHWCVEIVKSHSDVINGEHWKDYGFNYRELDKPTDRD